MTKRTSPSKVASIQTLKKYYIMSPWEKVPIGDKAPEVINVVIEIPKGSKNKYEFDEKLGLFKLDRVMHSSYQYPLDYGFIPETRSEDGDHLDVLVMVAIRFLWDALRKCALLR